MKLTLSSILLASLVSCSETFLIRHASLVGTKSSPLLPSSPSCTITEASSSSTPAACLSSPLFLSKAHPNSFADNNEATRKKSTIISLMSQVWNRLDAIENSGLDSSSVLMAGIGSNIVGLVRKVKTLPQDVKSLTWRDVKPVKLIKGLHGPITYLILAVVMANRYKWMWRNPAWWFGVLFCVKWIRARYVFKIPVWDRQPNWNNVITSKEQEKDLKAFTCKKCGSTIFIAKTREFFFEGATGIGGLGCFSCGAKGAENFVMDRDRIVEDVADMDDYFEYERPLDFISRAERRALMKEAGGDEDKANQMLIDRTNAQASPESQAVADSIVNGSASPDDTTPEAASVNEEEDDSDDSVVAAEEAEDEKEEDDDKEEALLVDVEAPASASAPVVESKVVEKPIIGINEDVKPVSAAPNQVKKTVKATPTAQPSLSDEDDMDALGMDDF